MSDLDSINDLDLDHIAFVKVIDVIGKLDSVLGSFDSQGRLINDPYPTAFESGGFDLDAIGVIHQGYNGVDRKFGFQYFLGAKSIY